MLSTIILEVNLCFICEFLALGHKLLLIKALAWISDLTKRWIHQPLYYVTTLNQLCKHTYGFYKHHRAANYKLDILNYVLILSRVSRWCKCTRGSNPFTVCMHRNWWTDEVVISPKAENLMSRNIIAGVSATAHSFLIVFAASAPYHFRTDASIISRWIIVSSSSTFSSAANRSG